MLIDQVKVILMNTEHGKGILRDTEQGKVEQ